MVVPRRTFIGSLFGGSLKAQDILEKQDEYKEEQKAPITILNKENSPNTKHFNAEEDMPDFKILQWKNTVVKKSELEDKYNSESVAEAINETYTLVFGKSLSQSEYASADLSDLQQRFRFFKALQQRLGFDVSDYTITRSHNVEYLFGELSKTVASRWSSERNPNAIVLRTEDFPQPNVYLNQELDEWQQNKRFEKLREEAQNVATQ